MLRQNAYLLLALALCATCFAQGEKPSTAAIRLDAAITIDGALTEPTWDAGEWNTGFSSASSGEDNRGAPKPADVQTRFKVRYDDSAVYVGVQCDEPTPETIRATIDQHDGTVWADDCIEVFFDPAGEGRYYHHFLINTLGAWYDDYSADYGLVHGKLWNCAIETAAKVDAGAKQWTLEVKIPYGGLILHEDTGSEWLWNVTRERHASGQLELTSWSPLKGNFHSPKLFGKLSGVNVDFRQLALKMAEPTVSVSRTGGGVNTLSITTGLTNETGATKKIAASAMIFGQPDTRVDGEPVTIANGAQAGISFPELTVRTSLPSANLLLNFADAQTGAILKSVVKQVSADYKPVSITVLKPCYRNNIYATEQLDEIVFRVALAPDIEGKAGSLFLGLKSAGGDMVSSKTVQLSDARGDLTLPATDLAEGTYNLIVEATDRQGKTLNTQETRIRKLAAPEAGNEVRIDEHGNVLVDGEPFLGIGWYGGIPAEDPRAEVVALQNLAIPLVVNPPDVSPVSGQFNERGVYSVVSVENGRLFYSFSLWRDKEKGDQVQGEPEKLSEPSSLTSGYLKQLVDAVKGEPGLLGYYIADEPEIHNTRSDYLENMYKLLTELDPYHPVIVTNDTLDGIVTHGYRCSDILSPDPYSPNLDYVPNFMKRCLEVLQPGQTTMLTPWHSSSQAHTTADYGTEPPYSYKVMRNQMLVAMVHGARGWTGYTSSFFMPEIDLRYGLPYIWRELRFLEKAIAAPAPEEPLEIETDAELPGWIRSADGNVYIALVNHKPGTRNATVSHPLLANVDRLIVASEGREIAVTGGSFTDTLDEGDARIYTTDPNGAELATTRAVEQELAQRKEDSVKPGNLLHVSNGTRATASEGYYAPWFDQYYYYAINGITDDLGWCASHAQGKPSWLELTMPRPAEIGRVVIYTPNLKDYDLSIQGPGGGVWEAQVRGNEQDVIEHNFSPALPCLKVRITALSARDIPLPHSKAPQVAEIEAYEQAGQGPATTVKQAAAAAEVPRSPIPAADMVEQNALWEDDFTEFASNPQYYWDARDTKWVLNPETFSATPKPGGGVVCSALNQGSAMTHFIPYAPEYRFLQVNLSDIEGEGYRFVNIALGDSSGKKRYRGAINTSRPGVYTVDTHYIDESFLSSSTTKAFLTAYMGQLKFTFDWMRLVKRPVDGLAVMMADGSPLPAALKQGDEILLHVILDKPATDVTVDVLADSSYKPIQINGEPYVQLLNVHPAPLDADAPAAPAPGDGTEWVARVKIGEGTSKFDQAQSGYPVVFRARIVGGSIKETYASAFVSFE